MQIYNTLTREKEEFQPREKGKVKMFVCGPTVYDYIHIGNARTFVFFDVAAKYLKYKGYEVDYVQNITDIDDKIINRAKAEGKSWEEISEYYFEEFRKDALALGITSPRYIKASDSIEEVKRQVKALKSKGSIYLIENDGWYFDLKTFPEYGKLSGRTAEMADDAVSRIDENDKKRNRGDFCVWKLSKPEEPFWPDEELGAGRPGWHIEDTAITEKEFGPQYDIHGGGQDLIFPHHEAEIAQQESASGQKPFVKYWMHAGFLVSKDKKMSKSEGNFETVSELLKKYSKETLRFYLLSGYYRSSLQFSGEILDQVDAAIQRIAQIRLLLLSVRNETGEKINLDTVRKDFYNAIDNDFNISEALGNIFTLIKQVNPLLVQGSIAKQSAEDVEKFLIEVNDLFNIIPEKYGSVPPQGIYELNDKREKLREAGNYEEADKIRAQIEEMGYKIEDTIYGPLITKL